MWTTILPILPEALAKRFKRVNPTNGQEQIMEPCMRQFSEFSEFCMRREFSGEFSEYRTSSEAEANIPWSPWHYVVAASTFEDVTLDDFKAFVDQLSNLPSEHGNINDYEQILSFLSKSFPYISFNSRTNYLLTHILKHANFTISSTPWSIETLLMPRILLSQDITITTLFLGKFVEQIASNDDVPPPLKKEFLKMLTKHCSKPDLKKILLELIEKQDPKNKVPVDDEFISKYIDLVCLQLVHIYGQPEVYSTFGIDEQDNPKRLAIRYALMLTEETKRENINLIARILVYYFRPDKKEEVYNTWQLNHDQIEKILPKYQNLLFKTYGCIGNAEIRIEDFLRYYKQLLTTSANSTSVNSSSSSSISTTISSEQRVVKLETTVAELQRKIDFLLFASKQQKTSVGVQTGEEKLTTASTISRFKQKPITEYFKRV